MSYCLNPDCQKPQNSSNSKFCQNCGTSLLLGDAKGLDSVLRYRAIKPIGQGGFGRTFLAVDEYKPSKSRCVIKQFFPQFQATNKPEKAAELFRQEAVRLNELGKHPQIPELLADFEQDNRQYLVQEFIDGQNLAEELAEEGAFKEAQIRQMLNDLLPALQFVHERQVIHRDIKPENIIRRISGQLVLVDFGASKVLTGTALARTGTLIGSAGYAAPEQTGGKAVFSSDLYSLGVTCIHLLTQIEPFDLYSFSEDDWVWRDYLTSPVSDQLGYILDKLIEKATKRRYNTAAEVLKELNPHLTQAAPMPPPLRVPPASVPMPLAALSAPAAPVVITSTSKPRAATWKCVHTLTGHSHWVLSVAISPQGKTFATGSSDKTIKLWDLATGKLLGTLTGHSQWVRAVAFSPDGKTLASGSDDKTVKIWDLATGNLLRTLTGHLASVCSVVISPNGHTLASGSRDKTIKVWRLDTGQRLHAHMGHAHWVGSIAISPDSQILASGSSDKTVKIWHLGMGQLLHVLQGHLDTVYAVAISPQGNTLASGSCDKTIRIWDLQSRKLRHSLKGHSESVYSLAISPDSQTLASGTYQEIKIWHLDTGQQLQILTEHSDSVYSVAFSPQGKTLVSGSADKTIKIWQSD